MAMANETTVATVVAMFSEVCDGLSHTVRLTYSLFCNAALRGDKTETYIQAVCLKVRAGREGDAYVEALASKVLDSMTLSLSDVEKLSR